MKYYFLLFSILFSINVLGQEINQDPFENRIIQKYYTISELKVLASDHPEKFKHIKYHYIHSFIIDETTLSNCPEFNPQLFDINDYEHLRLKQPRIIINTPCGVSITLLSKREMELLILGDEVIPVPNEYYQSDN